MKTIAAIFIMGLNLLLTGCMKPMTLAEKMEPIQPNQNTSYYFNSDYSRFIQAVATSQHPLFEAGKQDKKPDVIMGTAYASPNTSLTKVIIADLVFSRPVQSPFAYPVASFAKQIQGDPVSTFNDLLQQQQFKSLLTDHNCSIDSAYGSDYRSAYTFHSLNQGLYRRYKCHNAELLTDFALEVILSYKGNISDVVVSITEKDMAERYPKLKGRMHYETLANYSSYFTTDWIHIGFGFAETKSGPEWLVKVVRNGTTTYLESPVVPGSNHKAEISRYKEEYL